MDTKLYHVVVILILAAVTLTTGTDLARAGSAAEQIAVIPVEIESNGEGQEALTPYTGQPCAGACLAPDNGFGTVDLPAACPFVGLGAKMMIIDGLPAGTTIENDPELSTFTGIVRTPGGSLGGEILQFNAILKFDMAGTGSLAAFSRTVSIPTSVVIHTAPRTPATTPQSFAAELMQLQGQVTGDPDFDLLRVTAGTSFGLPSPGHMTLTQLPSGNWAVDSFFDITYRIDFIGAPGGAVAGMSGSTTGTIRMQQGFHHWVPADGHIMHFPQTPQPSGWDVMASEPQMVGDDWTASSSTNVKDIHFWGSWFNNVDGQILSFDISIREDIPASVTVPYSRPGIVLWQRTVTDFCALPMAAISGGWYDPALGVLLPANHTRIYQYDIELDPVDWFPQNVGTIYWLCISAKLASPSTTRWGWHSSANHHMDDGVWTNSMATCVAPDNGSGTATIPAHCPYGSTATMDIIDGLPPGTSIASDPSLHDHVGIVEAPGGTLGGTQSQFQSTLDLQMSGTGTLLGFTRSISLPMQSIVHTGPRVPGTSPQSFPTDYFQLFGQITGDPDFDLLRITGGTNFGLPSPGHTTLTQLPGGNWAVDSFFDITYRIDFVGAPGGALAGMSGSTVGTIHIDQGGPVVTPWVELWEPPAFTVSMDLAFVVTGDAPCDCRPGDADGTTLLSISDAVYLISYIFAGGPAPTPYPVCSGDANCDCLVSISDAVYLINYIFAGGPPPCDCTTWSIGCGLPLH